MYLKHVRLYKRHSSLKIAKRRLTLNRFDAILRCNGLILKMARIRFPGRPGQRIGKNYVKYIFDDVKMNTDPSFTVPNKINLRLKLFYELFGYSDEEEDFEGFTKEDIIKSEAVVARKLKTKEAVYRYLESNQELSSSAASDLEKCISSSDSDSPGSSLTHGKKGKKDILIQSCKIVKHKLDENNVHRNSLYSTTKQYVKSQHNLRKNLEIKESISEVNSNNFKSNNVNKDNIINDNCKLKSDANESKVSSKKYLKHLLNKTEKLRTHRNLKRNMRPNVKKKYKKRFLYSTGKYSRRMQNKSDPKNNKTKHKSWQKTKTESKSKDHLSVSTSLPTTESSLAFKRKYSRIENKKKLNSESAHNRLVDNASKSWQKTKIELKSKDHLSDSTSLPPGDNSLALKRKYSKVGNKKTLISESAHNRLVDNAGTSSSTQVKTANTVSYKHSLAVGRKRFILPSVSARSSRKIIPRKRYIDEMEQSYKAANDESRSQTPLSGTSEAISAMDGESSPDEASNKDEDSQNLKKIGLLDQPLVVEGKRPWKPSLKVQMKLSEMNCDYPFALKKNADGSSGTSSGSFKDIIKPDMVSKYAEKMAQKPKEKLPKIVESVKKSATHGYKSEPERGENDSSDVCEEKKPGDKLEKVAAKIEKLLKSQWEGRLKDSKAQSSKKISSHIMAQWKTEQQQQRSSNQRRTKNIIRKARLQIKKRNFALRTRQSIKQAPTVTETVNVQPLTEKVSSEPLGMVQEDKPAQDIIGVSPGDSLVLTKCVICGSPHLYISLSKLYEEIACQTCNVFFENFVKEPKQYFCQKEGKCNIEYKSATSRRASNTRCKACWLKVCIEKFTVALSVREQLLKYVPRLDLPPHESIVTVQDDELQNEKEIISRGPRIKHVCRRAAVALGLPRATFADITTSKETFNLSALPEEEKQKILDTCPTDEKNAEIKPEKQTKPASLPCKPLKPPPKKKLCKDVKVKNKVHLNLLKKSTLLIHKDQKKKKLQMKKSVKHMHKHSFKKSLKLSQKNQIRKTVKFSYQRAVKTSVGNGSKALQRLSTKPSKYRKVRCRECKGCLAEDCGTCSNCRDKKKFGGPNRNKQACRYRRCLKPLMPSEEKGDTSRHTDKNKPSGGPSSFGGGGPSGIGTSLTSSSSSPSSPDASSCGSSCTSSSTSSTSGSSGSSNSSTSSTGSSSSSSSSTSDNINASNSILINNCVTSSLMPNFESQSVMLHESECIDNNVAVFAESPYNDTFPSEPNLYDILADKTTFSEGVLENGDFKDSGDTILYEDSSSIIELKNASYGPSLLYGASLGEESMSYSSNSGYRNSQRGRTCKKSQFINKDHYGSAGSGSNGDDNEDDDDDEEDDERKKDFILADYWEDYDFERIASQGFALISSQQIPLPCVCYLCGSAGQEKMIFCVLCCEPYHTFCLHEDDVPNEENIENWCCKRCQSCAVCGSKNNLLKCKKCQNTYHADCLSPLYPTKPSRKKKVWVCPKCVKCKSCGTTSPAANAGIIWNFDLLLCHLCAKLTDKGIECF